MASCRLLIGRFKSIGGEQPHSVVGGDGLDRLPRKGLPSFAARSNGRLSVVPGGTSEAAAERLSALTISTVYASPIERTTQTAGYIAARYENRSPDQCLRFGVACGAESTARLGAALIDPREARRLMGEIELTALEAAETVA